MEIIGGDLNYYIYCSVFKLMRCGKSDPWNPTEIPRVTMVLGSCISVFMLFTSFNYGMLFISYWWHKFEITNALHQLATRKIKV
jgi:hypothetical protein